MAPSPQTKNKTAQTSKSFLWGHAGPPFSTISGLVKQPGPTAQQSMAALPQGAHAVGGAAVAIATDFAALVSQHKARILEEQRQKLQKQADSEAGGPCHSFIVDCELYLVALLHQVSC